MANDLLHDSAKREALAQRMAKLLGLPVPNVQLLMPFVPESELDKLADLPDDQFLKESTRLINEAQQRQAAGGEAGAAAAPKRKPLSLAKRTVGPPAGEAVPPGLQTLLAVESAPVSEAPPAPPAPQAAPASEDEAVPEAEAPEDAAPDASTTSLREDREPGERTELPAAFRRTARGGSLAATKKKHLVILVSGVAAIFVFGALFVYLLSNLVRPSKITEKAPDPDANPAQPPAGAKPNGPARPAPGPASAPVSARKFQHSYAWSVRQDTKLEVLHPDIAGSEARGLTVEFWFQVRNDKGLREISLAAKTDPESYYLTCGRDKQGQFLATFEVPDLKAKVSAPLPKVTGNWVHLAGVCSLGDPRQITLFANGQSLGSAPGDKAATELHAPGYVLGVSTEGSGGEVLIDEVRVASLPLYREPFTPARILDLVDGTVSLVHFEKADQNVDYDVAQSDKEISLPAGPEMVDWKTPSAPAVAAKPTPGGKPAANSSGDVEFPGELLTVLEKREGKAAVQNVLAEWRERNRQERLDYLKSIGYSPK